MLEFLLPPCFSPGWSCWGFLGLILRMLVCRVESQGVTQETSCAPSHCLSSPTRVWAQVVPSPFCQFNFLKGWDNSRNYLRDFTPKRGGPTVPADEPQPTWHR